MFSVVKPFSPFLICDFKKDIVFLRVETGAFAVPFKTSSSLIYFAIVGSAELNKLSFALLSSDFKALPIKSVLIETPPVASSNLTRALLALSFHILLVSSIALLTLTPVAILVPVGNSFIV